MLAPAWPYVGPCGPMLALSWPDAGPSGPHLGRCWPYVGAGLPLMLTHVAHILADVGPMLTPKPSREPVFCSGPLPKTQNHEKPMVF